MKEKSNSDDWPVIREPAGGLAEVSVVRCGKGRRTIRLGNVRLGDIVTSGKKRLLEFKGSKRDPVRVDAQELIRVLKEQVAEPDRG